MPSMPFFSINIPAYNVENYILDALESVASQTFTDWEVVVIDDGSTDRTKEICQSQQLIPKNKFTLIECENTGQYASRKRLLSASRGEIIVTLDADDMLIDTNMLDILHTVFCRTRCDLIMFNATRSLRTRAPFVHYGGVMIDSENSVNIDSALRELYCSYNLNNICTKAYRRELGSFSFGNRMIRNTEDRLQCIELFQNVEKSILINEPFYYYRQNPKSVTNSNYSLSYFEDFVFVEEQAEKYFKDRMNREVRLKRDRFLCKAVAVNLQRMHDSLLNPTDRINSYTEVLKLCINSNIFPNRCNKGHLDYMFLYNMFISGRFGRLDALLAGRRALRSIASKVHLRSGK